MKHGVNSTEALQGAMADLRSDTVTQPTAAMREVMKQAEVGDDVLGDDPTVNALQDKIAAMLGKQAALFVPSGTMSNAVAIRAQTFPGDEIVTELNSHIYVYEGGGYAALSGCSVALVPGVLGIMKPTDVDNAIRKEDGSLGHYPNGSLVCVENTSNRGGGTYYTQETLDDICTVAHAKSCRVHLDGARMFNAVVATGVNAERMTRDFDTVSICLSKGLGAPVGSLLVGDAEIIARAHRWRKMFGGGMRQAGVLAAAGIHALENHIGRLAEDHTRASRLAESIHTLPGFSVNLATVQTNMIYIEVDTSLGTAEDLVQSLAEKGVHVLSIDEKTIRAVTHLDVDNSDIDLAISAFTDISL